jgi:hypothetical protein
MIPETIAYAPTVAQKPSRAQLVPPSRTSTTAATPAAPAAFEVIPARQSPNDPAMTNIAAENDTTTDRAPRQIVESGCDPVSAGAGDRESSAARTVMRANNIAPSAALEAATAVAQPPLPASHRSVESAAAERLAPEEPDTAAALGAHLIHL